MPRRLMIRQPDALLSRVRLQMPHLTRTAICDLLGFPESDLRVIAPDVGGGFGQKMSLASEICRALVGWRES